MIDSIMVIVKVEYLILAVKLVSLVLVSPLPFWFIEAQVQVELQPLLLFSYIFSIMR